jgi:hypothetical protein
MLTLHRNGHEKKILLRAVFARSVALIIASSLTGLATADALGSTQARTSVDIIQLQKTAAQLAQQIVFPDDFEKNISIKIKKVWRSEEIENRMVLAPVVIGHKGSENKWCRLMFQKNKTSKFITAPSETSSDNCKGIARVVYVDLNRDGYPDVLLETVVPSNRYATNIVLPQVYISDSQGEYCYAGLASKALDSSWDGRAQSVRGVLDAEATRLGLDLMQCKPP